MIRAIVSIDFEVDKVQVVKKLIQHKAETAQRGAIAGLRGRSDAGSAAIADLMQDVVDSRIRD